ncbi:MAG: low-specificity L-threonine aldolase [Halieaceae bacterium]|jgi:threonine aldolase|nr:low-specificity L-threonine aldolase [Halieaceae bacterium]
MIDLRSDTVTQPTAAMRDAMYRAETGDDVYGEDPSVNALEALAARMTGKEAAVFAPSGTQSNLIAILSHCQRGHEYVVGQTGHTYLYEAGGAAVLGGIQPNPMPFDEDGTLPLDAVEATIKPDDAHFAITRLICLENTQAGKVLPMDYLARYSELALRHGLRRHLDGARVFNAAVALGVPVSDICRHFDTVSICLSKGLGCPVGSLLVGDADTIRAARRWRKMVGGGMRQAGVLAAAGIHALENHVERLREDHARATRVALALAELPQFRLREAPQSNMVMLAPDMNTTALQAHLAERGIRISGARWVFHLDISDDDVEQLIAACRAYEPGRAAA